MSLLVLLFLLNLVELCTYVWQRVYAHVFVCVCVQDIVVFHYEIIQLSFWGKMSPFITFASNNGWAKGKLYSFFLFHFISFRFYFLFYPSNFWSSVVCFFFSPMHIAFTTHRSLTPIPATIFHSYCCFAINKWAKNRRRKRGWGK